jgi:hypothetical protein
LVIIFVAALIHQFGDMLEKTFSVEGAMPVASATNETHQDPSEP